MSWVRTHARRIRSHKLAIVDRHPSPAHPELVITEEDERYLTSPYDNGVPLPPSASELSAASPRLLELRRRYADLSLPPLAASRWSPEAVDGFLDHRYFRGDSLITWHYRELPRATDLKYFVYAQYVRARDDHGLLDRLTEDGAFGCWTFSYPGHPRYSRDLIESVNEILFLERNLKIAARGRFSVLDIGAGYGRLAHRMTAAYPNLDDYCCVDAIPDSTFLCEYYLRHRGCAPPARAVPLDELRRDVSPGAFDLAINVHSFPECTYEAVAWWIKLIDRLGVPNLLIVPNEPGQLLTLEPDGTRRDFRPLIEQAGYEPVRVEPVITDPAAAELVRVNDEFHLFPPAVSVLRIACAADERYLAHCATMVRSLAASHPGVAAEVHFLHAPGLNPESVRRLASMSNDELTIIPHPVEPAAVAGLPAWGRIPATMWYRILLPELLPDAGRILYLDADVLVLDSLADLWALDLAGAYVAAVTNVPEQHMLGHAADLGLSGPERYFNSGVLLLNLELMRRDGCTSALRECALRNLDRLLWPDQDALNLVLGERRIALHPRWNLMNSIRSFPWSTDLLGRTEIAEAIARPAIIHFEGPAENKPWHVLCDHPARSIYAAHRGHTPWPRYRREGLTPGTAARLLRRRLLVSPPAASHTSASAWAWAVKP